jgi:hypothetical protein
MIYKIFLPVCDLSFHSVSNNWKPFEKIKFLILMKSNLPICSIEQPCYRRQFPKEWDSYMYLNLKTFLCLYFIIYEKDPGMYKPTQRQFWIAHTKEEKTKKEEMGVEEKVGEEKR